MLLGVDTRFDPIDLKACFLTQTEGKPDDKRIMIDIYYGNLFRLMIHSRAREGPGRERSHIIGYKASLKGCNTRGRNKPPGGKNTRLVFVFLFFFPGFSEIPRAQPSMQSESFITFDNFLGHVLVSNVWESGQLFLFIRRFNDVCDIVWVSK